MNMLSPQFPIWDNIISLCYVASMKNGKLKRKYIIENRSTLISSSNLTS